MMKLYKALKPYFVRGKFFGLGEQAHLHTLDGCVGGVLNLYNLSEVPQQIETRIPASKLGIAYGAAVEHVGQANISWQEDQLVVHADLPAWSPLGKPQRMWIN